MCVGVTAQCFVCYVKLLQDIAMSNELMGAHCIMQISQAKKKTGVIAPKRFVQRVKKQNELFRSYMHQVTCTSYSNVFHLICCVMVASSCWIDTIQNELHSNIYFSSKGYEQLQSHYCSLQYCMSSHMLVFICYSVMLDYCNSFKSSHFRNYQSL